jgi:O-antigen/teichoic acid export membrane protein
MIPAARAEPKTILGNINTVLFRIGRNTGWLLGGKGLGAVLSIVYLAIAARTLGPDRFGQFALVLTYAQAVNNLVQFNSWQTLIRFGAGLAGERERFSRLVCFTAMLDAVSAVLGALAAVAGVALCGPFLGWSGAEQHRAALFGLSLIFALRATPTGILRLFDRFDLAMLAESVLPAGRFLGAVLGGLFSGGVITFLVAWALAELLSTLALWLAAAHELARRDLDHRPRGRWLKTMVRENPGIWRFAWFTNATATLALVWRQVGTLAVGIAASPAAAGGYRLAQQIAQALAKPLTSLARAGYPEFAHLVACADPRLVPLTRRLMFLTGGIAAVLIALTTAFGGPVLTGIAGADYAFARPYLVLLTIAVAAELCAVVLEPLLLALGLAGRALALRAVASGVYLAAISGFMMVFGALGAALGAIAGSFVLLAVMALAVRRALPGQAARISAP